MRISGIELNKKKPILQALTRVFGIGDTRAKALCERAKIPTNTRVSEITDEQSLIIQSDIDENYVVEGDLKSIITSNKQEKIRNRSYTGIRLAKGITIRGRTRSNGRTARKLGGNKKMTTNKSNIKGKGGK